MRQLLFYNHLAAAHRRRRHRRRRHRRRRRRRTHILTSLLSYTDY
jgi:hypothetical protein